MTNSPVPLVRCPSQESEEVCCTLHGSSRGHHIRTSTRGMGWDGARKAIPDWTITIPWRTLDKDMPSSGPSTSWSDTYAAASHTIMRHHPSWPFLFIYFIIFSVKKKPISPFSGSLQHCTEPFVGDYKAHLYTPRTIPPECHSLTHPACYGPCIASSVARVQCALCPRATNAEQSGVPCETPSFDNQGSLKSSQNLTGFHCQPQVELLGLYVRAAWWPHEVSPYICTSVRQSSRSRLFEATEAWESYAAEAACWVG
ncbi:hypothetical protein LZ31DRAFT_261266 [Colletotrichum somersetense]|nr:hypothetical protein LZ31DRAFT_261266 [Colletotrichum somersetense]